METAGYLLHVVSFAGACGSSSTRRERRFLPVAAINNPRVVPEAGTRMASFLPFRSTRRISKANGDLRGRGEDRSGERRGRGKNVIA